jgi:hypothetical protein
MYMPDNCTDNRKFWNYKLKEQENYLKIIMRLDGKPGSKSQVCSF